MSHESCSKMTDGITRATSPMLMKMSTEKDLQKSIKTTVASEFSNNQFMPSS